MPPRSYGKRRALGQHYLVDSSVVAKMILLAGINPGHRVLEIGTGRGELTRGLAAVSKNVEAFELDESNYRATKALGLGIVLRHADAFAGPNNFDVLVSSLPYSESSNFVEWLAGHHYERAVVLLQKDFVDKLLSLPGQASYRAVSVVSQMSSEVRPELGVARESFTPAPKVSSVVAVITSRRTLTRREIATVKTLFSQRRRRLKGALKHLKLEPGHIDQDSLSKRVCDLSPSEFERLLSEVLTAA